MEIHSHFDYIIIGNGLAGLQLALRMSEEPFFSSKTVALIDPSEKSINDKTWSFWEKEPSRWHSILNKTWQIASIFTSEKAIELNFNPYSYNSIRAIDFYDYAKSELKNKNNFQFVIDKVEYVSEDTNIRVQTTGGSYTASHIFDSRIPQSFYSDSKSIKINQHFKGIVIKTETDVFDDANFTMMDYRLKDGEQTTFMYVLPFSKNEALFEFTYFTEQVVEEIVYAQFIEKYIKTYLDLDTYEVIESEQGNIPMTTFDFAKFNTKNITKIGTGGGWVKPSTGYSFKNTENKISKVIENIKQGKTPSENLFKSKYKFYDKVFLRVLKDENHKGEWVFQQFYYKNSTETMFRFLDEESTFFEELKIMWSLFSWSFIRAFFKTL
ncbi:MAG: lycopene cyclase family protein [Jejuia sp.]